MRSFDFIFIYFWKRPFGYENWKWALSSSSEGSSREAGCVWLHVRIEGSV